MASNESTVQRSFRLSRTTLDELDALARSAGTSRNSLAERLLSEALRIERHPLVRFRTGASGRRRALVIGTRLYVYQLISALRGNDGDIDATAAAFGVTPQLVRAGLAYYADFGPEVDEDAAVAAQVERDERQRWERQQQAIA